MRVKAGGVGAGALLTAISLSAAAGQNDDLAPRKDDWVNEQWQGIHHPNASGTPKTQSSEIKPDDSSARVESSDFVARGLSLGVRSGWAFPVGSIASGAALSDAATGTIPIWVDAGFKFNPHVYVGGYFQYGFVLPSNCPSGASCSGSDMRFGADLLYHVTPQGNLESYVGVGVGYEILSLSVSSVTATASGFEFGNVQLGFDYRASPNFAFGPFAVMTFSEFASNSVSGGSASGSGSIQDKTLHEWVVLGLRGVFEIGF